MRNIGLIAAVALLCLLVPGRAHASQVILTFDDIPQGAVGSYDGVTFDAGWTMYTNHQNPYNPHSGTGRVFDSVANGGLTFSQPTQVLGAWFAGPSSTVQFNLYNGATLVASSTVLWTSSTPTFLSTNYTGTVTRATVIGSASYFVMDDLTLFLPEPAMLLLLLPLAVLVLRRRSVPA
jgi:hypothetical protein